MPSERVRLIREGLETFAESGPTDEASWLNKLKPFNAGRYTKLEDLTDRYSIEGVKFAEFLVFDPAGCNLTGSESDYTSRLFIRLARPSIHKVFATHGLTVGDLRDLSDTELAVLCGNLGDVTIVRKLFGRTPSTPRAK